MHLLETSLDAPQGMVENWGVYELFISLYISDKSTLEHISNMDALRVTRLPATYERSGVMDMSVLSYHP